RHLFREEEIERWAEDRGVLVKAIEDIALGTASVYRQLELPLPAKLPYGDRKTLEFFADLLAKIMPFDLVINEQTADGREARVWLDTGSVPASRGCSQRARRVRISSEADARWSGSGTIGVVRGAG